MTRVFCATPAFTSFAGADTATARGASEKRSGESTIPFQLPPLGDVRADLVLALTAQAAVQSQRAVRSVVAEAAKYFNWARGEARNLEEALMTVPDLETIPYKVILREESYEIRVVQSYLIAETELPGRSAFDFFGSGQGFNTLADYLFGKNTKREAMEMTTPVVVRKGELEREKMEMTTPVVSQKDSEKGIWRMAFVLPSKYSEEDVPVPENSSVKIRRVPSKTVAVTAFSGYVTDDLVNKKEQKLRQLLQRAPRVRVRGDAQPEVSQYNPPFTPPFARRNEIALEVEYDRE